MKTVALILAGGSGTRIKGTNTPKQFLLLDGKPMFIHCLKLYDRIKEIDEIFFVINPRFMRRAREILKKSKIKKLTHIIPGGKARQESIRNAFKHVGEENGLIVVQNAVSPTVSVKLIKDCLKAARRHRAVTAYMPAFHTVFEKEGPHRIGKVLRRSSIGYTCDPQVYKTDVLAEIMKNTRKNLKKDVPMLWATDQLGIPIHLVESSSDNIKTTFTHDIKAIEHVLKERG